MSYGLSNATPQNSRAGPRLTAIIRVIRRWQRANLLRPGAQIPLHLFKYRADTLANSLFRLQKRLRRSRRSAGPANPPGSTSTAPGVPGGARKNRQTARRQRSCAVKRPIRPTYSVRWSMNIGDEDSRRGRVLPSWRSSQEFSGRPQPPTGPLSEFVPPIPAHPRSETAAGVSERELCSRPSVERPRLTLGVRTSTEHRTGLH